MQVKIDKLEFVVKDKTSSESISALKGKWHKFGITSRLISFANIATYVVFQ